MNVEKLVLFVGFAIIVTSILYVELAERNVLGSTQESSDIAVPGIDTGTLARRRTVAPIHCCLTSANLRSATLWLDGGNSLREHGVLDGVQNADTVSLAPHTCDTPHEIDWPPNIPLCLCIRAKNTFKTFTVDGHLVGVAAEPGSAGNEKHQLRRTSIRAAFTNCERQTGICSLAFRSRPSALDSRFLLSVRASFVVKNESSVAAATTQWPHPLFEFAYSSQTLVSRCPLRVRVRRGATVDAGIAAMSVHERTVGALRAHAAVVRVCDAFDDIGKSGRWLRLTDSALDALSAAERAALFVDAMQHEWTTSMRDRRDEPLGIEWLWAPDDCRFRWWRRSDIGEGALRGSRVLLLGDSRLRGLFCDIVHFARGIDPDRFSSIAYKNAFNASFFVDEDIAAAAARLREESPVVVADLDNSREIERAIIDEGRGPSDWNTFACGFSEGGSEEAYEGVSERRVPDEARIDEFDAMFSYFQLFHAPSFNVQRFADELTSVLIKMGKHVSVVLHSGLWSKWSFNESMEHLHGEALQELLQAVSRVCSSDLCARLIWLDSQYDHTHMQNNGFLARVNNMAQRTVALPGSVLLHGAMELTLSRPDLTIDGHHFFAMPPKRTWTSCRGTETRAACVRRADARRWIVSQLLTNQLIGALEEYVDDFV